MSDLDKYRVILADPPWKYGTWTKKGTGRTSETHYDSISTKDLANIWGPSITQVRRSRNCALFLWTTSPLLIDALHVMANWGFMYRTIAFTWVKTTKNGKGHFGMGGYTRPGSEICLLGINGSMKVKSHSIRQVIQEPVREHSRKPDLYERIEALFDGPYLELFARQKKEGWDSWGNETMKYQISSRALPNSTTQQPE